VVERVREDPHRFLRRVEAHRVLRLDEVQQELRLSLLVARRCGRRPALP
jgi:hypothetical protein